MLSRSSCATASAAEARDPACAASARSRRIVARGGFARDHDHAIGRSAISPRATTLSTASRQAFVDHDEARLRCRSDVDDLAFAVAVVDRHHDGADRRDREPGQRHGRLVRQHDRDMVPLRTPIEQSPAGERRTRAARAARRSGSRRSRRNPRRAGRRPRPRPRRSARRCCAAAARASIRRRRSATDGTASRATCWRRITDTRLTQAYQIAFQSVYLSIACSDLSRPWPDCLKPPNGTDMLPRSKQFTQTTPARIALAARCAFRMSFVQTPGGEAVNRVVGDGQRLVEIPDRDRRQNRAEDLLLRDLHVVADAVEHGRLDEEAVGQCGDLAAAGDDGRAVLPAALRCRTSTRSCCSLLTSGPILVSASKGSPIAQVPGVRDDAIEQLVLDRAVDDEPRAGVADLPGIGEDTGRHRRRQRRRGRCRPGPPAATCRRARG